MWGACCVKFKVVLLPNTFFGPSLSLNQDWTDL